RDGAVAAALVTPTRGRRPETDGFRLRTQALLSGVPLFTCVDTFAAYLEAMGTTARRRARLPIIVAHARTSRPRRRRRRCDHEPAGGKSA
ncbi:hypothetical protein, partial [Calditerricola satsumensis]|uniref:hypothetical protein n=1 Tax=Calditerricola satsumensis TaxID=373054 RepID=UPI001C469260